MELSDEHLMEAVKKEKLDNLSLLFDRYQKRLYNYFLKCGLSLDDSSDLTQNVFIRVMKYRHSFKTGSNFQVWLFRIARNQMKDHFSKMKVNNDRFATVSMLPDTVDEGNEQLEDQERWLMSALAKLPDEKRELLVLSKFEGMKYEQLAELRSTSVSAIKVQVHRTIKQLRDIYFNEQEEV